jgi:multidrug efflux pump subunit AcrA (membrane-fusion protein)
MFRALKKCLGIKLSEAEREQELQEFGANFKKALADSRKQQEIAAAEAARVAAINEARIKTDFQNVVADLEKTIKIMEKWVEPAENKEGKIVK